jgi:hypothetical protein
MREAGRSGIPTLAGFSSFGSSVDTRQDEGRSDMPINIEGYEPPYICEKSGCEAEAVVEREVQRGNGPGAPLRLCKQHDEER